MKKLTPRQLVTRLAATAGRSRAAKGRADRPAAGGRQALGRSLLAGLLAPKDAAAGPTLEQFLDTAADVDLEIAARLRAAVKDLGLSDLPAPGLETARAAGVPVLPLLDDIIAGLRRCAAAAAGGATADELQALQRLRVSLRGLARVIDWAMDRIRTGQQVLEAYQREAQTLLAGELLLALSQPQSESEWLALMQDAAEVLELEETRLLSQAALRERNQADREDLSEQTAATNKDVALLKTLQDLRARRPVQREVLADMAAYYMVRGDTADGAETPQTLPAPKTKKPRAQPRR